MVANAPYFDNSIVEPIEIRMIRPSKFPVRCADDKNAVEFFNLKESIREHGLLQPIVIRPLEHGFEIVAGHRRFSACKSLRWRFIPCKIREFSDKQAYEIQLAENVQRKSMDPIEEAEAYQKYVVDFGWGGVSDLGKKIGKSEEYVSHRIMLLKLPQGVKDRIISRGLNVSQALELTNASDTIRAELIDEVIDGNLTVRQIRRRKHDLAENTDNLAYRSGQEGFKRESRPKDISIIKKSTLVLKVTLSRIDDLIEDAHKSNIPNRVDLINYLMSVRRATHDMIDEGLRYKKSHKPRC